MWALAKQELEIAIFSAYLFDNQYIMVIEIEVDKKLRNKIIFVITM